MARLLGIDVGTKKVGLAFADTETAHVWPHGAVARARGQAESEIRSLCSENEVAGLIVGLPLDRDGGETEQCESVRAFCRRLERRINVPINFVDEHLSTEEAYARVEGGGKSYSEARRTGTVDAVAACVLLEEYLARSD